MGSQPVQAEVYEKKQEVGGRPGECGNTGREL